MNRFPIRNDKDWNDAVSNAFQAIGYIQQQVGDAALSATQRRYHDTEFLKHWSTTEAALRKAAFMVFYLDAA